MPTFLAFFLIANLALVSAQQWEDPKLLDPETPGVDFQIDQIVMEEEMAGEVVIAIINYEGNTEPSISFLVPPLGSDLTGMTVKRRTDSKWNLIVTKKQDYESANILYEFDINVASQTKMGVLHIKNIDDWAPVVTPITTRCEIEEDTIDPNKVNCLYQIRDEDGELDGISWTINDNKEHEFFEFQIQSTSRAIPADHKEMILALVLKKKLDFKTASLHIIDLKVMDSKPHEASLRIVIEVTDIPNQDPVWKTIFASQEFDERTEQTFYIEAQDGDWMVNDDISYSVIKFSEEEDWMDYISIEKETGKISVKEFDRDALQREIFKFIAIACEVNFTPNACVQQDITFIVNDINNNVPEFSIVPLDGNILEIAETMITSINTEITVKDIDLGENARYSLVLKGTNDEIKHEEAFQVAPSSGYQETALKLYIVNPDLLDYEKEDWQSFDIQLIGVEDVPSEIKTPEPLIFHVTLINRNDEIPIFKKCNDNSEPTTCVIKIPETFPGNAYLVTMLAEDADIGGSVEHSLLGSYANRILVINSGSGEISTQDLARPFDYETLSEVIVQVQAKDSLPSDTTQNIVLAQLTITLEDVNDETPRLDVEYENLDMYIVENRPDGEKIGATIIATDEDSMATLEVHIDWSESEAIKNGRKIKDTAEFAPYMGCVVLDIDEASTGQKVTASLRFKETVPDNTPDYEIFDSLDLVIVATDTDQTNTDEIPNRVSIKVQIYITDDNDNEPEFVDTTLAKKTVTENACPGGLIGFVSATDKDVDDELSYSIEPRDGTAAGLVTINEKTGELLVGGNEDCKSIDADVPLDALYYTVYVTDTKHKKSAEIEITVEDLNDNNPIFDRVGEDGITVEIDEQAPEGTLVEIFTAVDKDRDEANNKVTYSISSAGTSSAVRGYFKIDESTGRVYVSYTNEIDKLDRDEGQPPPPITITIDAKDPGYRTGSLSFTVVLKDINNKSPELITKQLSIGEQSKEGDVVESSIAAKDADEPGHVNSMIYFEITSIDATQDYQTQADKDLFVLFDENNLEGTVRLKAGKDLRTYYDDYKITLQMKDGGISNTNQVTDTLIIKIEKYNFEDPIFTYPENEQTIHLSKSQGAGRPLVQHNGDLLASLQANDQQGNKFKIVYSIEDERKLITQINSGGDTLTVTTDENLPVNIPFEITITAISEGTPETKSSITVKMIFIDENITPVFTPNEFAINDFFENRKEQEFPFPKAEYEVDLDLDLKIYYLIETKDSPFTIKDSQTPILYLHDELDREQQKEYTVIVQTSNREVGVGEPDARARLTIQIEIQDENDNPPVFEEEKYFAIFLYDDKETTTLLTVVAQDRDDNDVVNYELKEPQIEGSSFPKLGIVSDNGQGHIVLMEDATSAAKGYATVLITASDGDPAHDVDAPLEVYVVSEDTHIVKFKFDNEVEEIEAVKKDIVSILMETFKSENDVSYEANIKRTTLNNEEIDDESARTVSEIYFIDTENHIPLQRSAIEVLANDINTYIRLEQQFEAIGLSLISFSTIDPTVDNTVEVLRAWLIGIAVVLGCLCVLLIIAFVLKTRSLTKRLNKLSVTKYGSQESGLNRKVVPNTNRHALEGSNPVYSSEKKTPEFDRESISSGDSDLIGVENNPDFQRKPEKEKY